MRLIIEETSANVAEWSAKYVVKKIRDFNPHQDKYFVLGLPTVCCQEMDLLTERLKPKDAPVLLLWLSSVGDETQEAYDCCGNDTPLGMYKKLIEYYNSGKVSFKYVKTFNMDEYVALPRDHEQSYHYFMWNNFFKFIDIDPKNVHILNGNAPDLQSECENFEKDIILAGGVDLFIGGIGPDGHIAFNEPGSSLVSRTRIKTLAQDTLEANARFFDNDINKVPQQALTVGVGTVMDAKEVMVLITGAHKSFALYKAIEEGVNHMWTISAFQQHNNTIFVCDEDATLELRVKTVKYFKSLSAVHRKLIED